MGLIPAIALVVLIGGVASQDSICPKDKPLVNCLIDPCTYTDCAPGHRCESNYCGGCNAKCVSTCSQVMCRMWCPAGFKKDKNGCEICECVDPCARMKCSRGHICRNGECIPNECTHNGKTYAVGMHFPRGDGCNSCFCDAPNSVACTEAYCPHCQYNGNIYKPGDSFNSTDGCNTCSCSESGQVACTEKACLPDQNAANECTHNGKTYAVGMHFPRGDGCNSCFCNAPNSVACTKVYCPHCQYNGNIYKPGDSFNSTDGCNTCSCSENGQVACTEKACLPDQNAGCPADKPFTECPYNPCIAALCVTGTRCVADQCGGCFARCLPLETKQCSVDGKTYNVGDDFPSSDGCNTCTCSASGFPICTLRACLPPNQCTAENGKTYNVGDTFPASDGCNTCTCTESGVPVCTLKACHVCPLYKCKACTTGYVIDENGCQTCQCKDPTCEGVTCAKGSFCSNSYCCPDEVKVMRCTDPCANKYCGIFKVCKRYCNCYADCVWWFLAQ
ncbi:kielin/chordin-like protein isoform X2 [Liolophura sinensis]|uniref:kielin/chordin-like protein isoform X2 n=1 Tax=Liolophura sinensis TaxID=3198878 RepID=UPI0031597108